MLAIGKTKCLVCSEEYKRSLKVCPRCGVPMRQSKIPPVAQGGQALLVKEYEGNTCTEDYHSEAAVMHRAGWRTHKTIMFVVYKHGE